MAKVNKSLGKNSIINMLRVVLQKCFALITFPYTSRVLGPEYIGRVDFAQSVMTYFTLIAAFGVASYSVREGARIRDDRKKLDVFASEMLSINLVTVFLAYAMFLIVYFLPRFTMYRNLLLAFSVTIILNALGMEWIYNIFEDYTYITLRALGFQVLSVILLFTCVKSEKDYFIYALILVIASVGSNVLNFLRARRYVDIKLTFSRSLLRHIKPMTLIFVMNVAVSIYLVMDRSMLGLITGSDTEVGLYATAINVTSIISACLTSVWSVITPRVAYALENDKSQVDRLAALTGNTILMLAIPAAVGVALLSGDILWLFAGDEFLPATSTLRLLMIEVIISGVNGFLINQLFITYRKDKQASIAVVLGALANIIMNAITIPMIGRNGAAISTCLSELTIFIFACVAGREIFKVERLLKQVMQSLVATLTIVVLYAFCLMMGWGSIITILVTVPLGAAAYFGVLLIMKNKLLQDMLNGIRKKV